MELKILFPEIVMLATCMALSVIKATGKKTLNRFFYPTAFLGLGAAWIQVFLLYGNESGLYFNSTYAIDAFALFFKNLLIGLGFLSLLSISAFSDLDEPKQARCCILLVALIAVGSTVVSSHDLFLTLIALIVGHVLQVLLLTQSKDQELSTEAALKSFLNLTVCLVLFAVVVGFFLFNTGVSELGAIKEALLHSVPFGYGAVFVILFAVLGFYIGVFPLIWSFTDIVSGASSIVGAIHLTIFRSIGVGVFLRIATTVFSKSLLTGGSWEVLGVLDWRRVIECSALATMIIGALQCATQTNVRRFLASLMLFQNGFLLLGILVMDQIGLMSVLFELIVTGLSILGLFFVFGKMSSRAGSDELAEIRDKVSHPISELVLFSIFLLSIVGVPPFPGFISKFTILASVLRQDMYLLVVISLLGYCVACIAIGRLLFGLLSRHRYQAIHSSTSVYILIISLPLFYFTVFAQPVLKIASESLGFK